MGLPFKSSGNAFDSHHPEHTKNNIPYNLAKRIHVICSEEAWIEKNLRDLKEFLLDRSYPPRAIENGFYKAKLRGPANNTSNQKVVPLITPYLGNLDTSNIVNTTRDLIMASSNERLRNAFDEAKFVQCHTQTPNILQLLSSSRFFSSSTNHNEEKGTVQCSNKLCQICRLNYIQQCKSFKTSNGTDWKIKRRITCNAKNCIYFLKCKFCIDFTKLGKTDDLRLRTNNHRSCCRNGNGSDIFDNHVFICSRLNGSKPPEPLFLLFVMMECNDYDKLLSIERKLHLEGHDTAFNLL